MVWVPDYIRLPHMTPIEVGSLSENVVPQDSMVYHPFPV